VLQVPRFHDTRRNEVTWKEVINAGQCVEMLECFMRFVGPGSCCTWSKKNNSGTPLKVTTLKITVSVFTFCGEENNPFHMLNL
jgi:hypothetical protein